MVEGKTLRLSEVLTNPSVRQLLQPVVCFHVSQCCSRACLDHKLDQEQVSAHKHVDLTIDCDRVHPPCKAGASSAAGVRSAGPTACPVVMAWGSTAQKEDFRAVLKRSLCF